MKTTFQLFNELTEGKALVNSSIYFQNDDKLVRFANHKCNYKNIELYNEGVNHVLLIFTGQESFDENEISEHCEEVSEMLDISVDYLIHESDDDFEYIKLYFNRFINK